jgi:hypothetical protein
VLDVLLLLLVLFHLDNLVLSHGLDVGVIVTLAGEGGRREKSENETTRREDKRRSNDRVVSETATIKELSSESHPCST